MIVLACSLADLLIVPTLALTGVLMAPLSLSIILGLLVAAVVFAFALDEAKARVFDALEMR